MIRCKVKDFIEIRAQVVWTDIELSESVVIESGVLQGDLFSPSRVLDNFINIKLKINCLNTIYHLGLLHYKIRRMFKINQHMLMVRIGCTHLYIIGCGK